MIRATTPFTPLLEKALSQQAPYLHTLIFKGYKAIFREFVGKMNINKCITQYNITPLHVCAMVGAEEEADELMRRGARLAIQDWKGCNALHIAAMMGNQILLNKFRAVAESQDKAILQQLNWSNGTPASITRWLEPKPVPTGIVAFYKNSTGKLEPLTAVDYEELTGFAYNPSILVTTQGLVQEWASKPCHEELLEFDIEIHRAALFKALEDHNKEPSTVYIEKEGEAGLGGRAKGPLQPGDVIKVYAGELHKPEKGESVYVLHSIDGTEGNEASRFNDGLPKAVTFLLPIDGLDVPVVFAIRKLAPGEWIHIDYSIRHRTKWGRCTLFALEDFEKFVRGLDIDRVIQNYADNLRRLDKRKNWPTHEEYLYHQGMRSQVSYLINTPAALAYAVFKRLLPYEPLEANLKRGNFWVEHFVRWKPNWSNVEIGLLFYSSFFKIMRVIDKKRNPELGQKVLDYFLDNFKKYPVILACEVVWMFAIHQQLDELLSNAKLYKEYLAGMDDFIKFFLNIEKRALQLKLPEKAEEAKAELTRIFKTNQPAYIFMLRPMIVRFCNLAVGWDAYLIVNELLNKAGFDEKDQPKGQNGVALMTKRP